ncbi:MAG: ROK family protein [Propionibacteriaceae bacterium]|nr:ROK family protein [Propionibacteriaceae bacterium]
MSATDDRVVQALREHGGLTRHGLTATTELSLATLNRAIDRLVNLGRVVVIGREASTGGRPPEIFAYNGEGQVVAGISVTDTGATALLMTLDGGIVGRDETIFGRLTDPEVRLQLTCGLLDRIVDQPERRLVGIGVAVPGVVTGRTGTVSAIHELGWDRLALGDLLSRRAGLPVFLDNDANCLAVAEHRRGAGRGVANLVSLVVRNGLGAGLITNGQLYRGMHHEAGEIGYLLTGRDSLRRLFPDRGELEQLIGGKRLSDEAARLGLDLSDEPTLPNLIVLGHERGGKAGKLADELLDLTALSIAALCVVLDPELVIIGGSADETGMSLVIDGVRERLIGRILRVPPLRPAGLGADAIMIGAASFAADGLSFASAN